MVGWVQKLVVRSGPRPVQVAGAASAERSRWCGGWLVLRAGVGFPLGYVLHAGERVTPGQQSRTSGNAKDAALGRGHRALSSES